MPPSRTGSAAYQQAIDDLKRTPGWSDLDPTIQHTLLQPLEVKTYTIGMSAVSLQQLRADTELCPVRLAAAQNKLAELVSTATIERIDIRPYFAGGIETEEQLQAALDGIREACAEAHRRRQEDRARVADRMEKSTRNAIERATQKARKLLEAEFADQLEGTFDILRDGHVGAGQQPDAGRRTWRAARPSSPRSTASARTAWTPSRR